MTPIILSWSGGKDSALALDALRGDARYQLTGLLSTVNRDYGRISIHGVRESLLDSQAASLGLPLYKVKLSAKSSNEEYEKAMGAMLAELKGRGIGQVAFGDLFLEDLRAWRERNLATAGMTGVFPIWKRDTHPLARQVIAPGG